MDQRTWIIVAVVVLVIVVVGYFFWPGGETPTDATGSPAATEEPAAPEPAD